MIERYSSRLFKKQNQELGKSFLAEKLKKAKAYDRIAGFFSPSILEIAGEEIQAIPKVRMVANSKITFPVYAVNNEKSDPAFKGALWNEWCEFGIPEKEVPGTTLEKLFHLLNNKQLEVRILPDDRFGLIHGKAGVITFHDETKTSFMGSANESLTAWKLNYELVWEDTATEAINWVQTEFDALWGDAHCFELTEEIIKDIQRTAKRKIQSVPEWQNTFEPASPVIESPVYRKQNGLWNHQKYFVQRAFDEHTKYGGTRLILADQVGLGKTLQLSMAAQLMALYGDLPILIIVPKTLMQQWQEEFMTLLDVPSAYWSGKCWVDENDIEHEYGIEQLTKCPRKIGIISQGLISRKGEAFFKLLKGSYECVIVDEAHRARRKKIGNNPENQHAPEVNNLLEFITNISSQTKSLLLATATPVQLHPIEIWDLLSALARGNKKVYGNDYSKWRKPNEVFEVINQPAEKMDDVEFWNWLRNPLPPADERDEDKTKPFATIRRDLNMNEKEHVADLELEHTFDAATKNKIKKLKPFFFKFHNPFIRHVIRRTRDYLENTLDPETNQPYLQKVEVELFGENNEEAMELPGYLQNAYDAASEYCKLLGERKRGTGFLETLLLRRIGSSMIAGLNTAKKLLGEKEPDEVETEEEDYAELFADAPAELDYKNTAVEAEALTRIVNALSERLDDDPKYNAVVSILDAGARDSEGWRNRGCILFSQYYDTANWVAEKLSRHYHELEIGLYAGSGKSAIYKDGRRTNTDRNRIKQMVKEGKIQLLVGTDAASEGLNLQVLGSLINLDLPWNPTRLEQRKGRIQRIGQKYRTVFIYNMRYKNSVEDKVHERLSERLEAIKNIFGQIPDTLEDVWVQTALGKIEEAENRINAVPERHPFDIKYNTDANVTGARWEECSNVLNTNDRYEYLKQGW